MNSWISMPCWWNLKLIWRYIFFSTVFKYYTFIHACFWEALKSVDWNWLIYFYYFFFFCLLNFILLHHFMTLFYYLCSFPLVCHIFYKFYFYLFLYVCYIYFNRFMLLGIISFFFIFFKLFGLEQKSFNFILRKRNCYVYHIKR